MSESSEEVANCCAIFIACINFHYNKPGLSVVIQLCAKHPDITSPLSLGLIRTLNSNAFPYSDRCKLECIIKCCRDIFMNESTAKFFYTTDLNILVDIVIRECGSLPMEDDVSSA